MVDRSPENVARAREVLDDLKRQERLHVAFTPEHADQQVLSTYRQLRASGREAAEVFVSTDVPNARVENFNRMIQLERMRHGEIGGAHLDCYAQGAARYETLHVGDRVVLAAGTTVLGDKLPNGSRGTLTSMDYLRRRAVVHLDGGLPPVALSVPETCPQAPLRLAYAGRPGPLQGSEAGAVLVVPHNRATSLSPVMMAHPRGGEVHVFADRITHGQDPADRLAELYGPAPSLMEQMAQRLPTSREQAAGRSAEQDQHRESRQNEVEPIELQPRPEIQRDEGLGRNRGLIPPW